MDYEIEFDLGKIITLSGSESRRLLTDILKMIDMDVFEEGANFRRIEVYLPRDVEPVLGNIKYRNVDYTEKGGKIICMSSYAPIVEEDEPNAED